jgi:transposase-like protein
MRSNEPATTAAERRCCPYCLSDEIRTTGKGGQTNTYWRCSACGEIWNPLSTPAAPKPRPIAWR